MNMKQLYFQKALKRAYPRRPPRRLKKLLYPARIEETYATQISQILKFMKKKVDEKIVPMLPGLVDHYARVRADADDIPTLADELESIRIQTSEEYTPAQIEKLAQLTGKSVDEWNAMQLNGQLKGITEIDLFGAEPWLAREMGAFVTDNVNLITSVGDEYLNQILKLVSTNIRAGLRSDDLASELEDRYDVAQSRANLIARDQIGKFNGQMTELRQTDLGIDEYTWMDSGDARVRPSHHENNGKTFRWDDPPSTTGHPGNDFQCRCWAEPSLDKFYEDAA